MSTGGGGQGRASREPGGPDKEPRLLPTPALEWSEFEEFTERLLNAHRSCPEPVVHVVHVERWGRRGDKQDGIDFAGTLSDGRRASWQCKRQDTLTAADVRAAVAACTFQADVHHLVYSGEASQQARAEMRRNPGWRLVDRRGLGMMVDDLPLHRRRDLLDATWGRAERRRLLAVAAEDAFVSLEAFDHARRDPSTVLNDLAPHVGRERELADLAARLANGGDVPVVVIVNGPGGRGKTRLLVEVLRRVQEEQPTVPVLVLAPGRMIDAVAIGELPLTPAIVVVDDAHQDPAGLAHVLRYAQETSGTQLVLATRPSGLQTVRRQVAAARMPLPAAAVEVGPLSRQHARKLVASLTEGLNLRAGGREYLAGQATTSPHVAVIAAHLIRRGDLQAPVVVDDQLREQVMARYEELAAPATAGVDVGVVRRFLAVYAALGPVDDEAIAREVEVLCELKRRQRLDLVEHLRDSGVLVTREGQTRVVPDVLADDFLEREAAVGTEDTGFAGELWETFGATHRDRLLPALGELDWRLARRGGPAIFAGVWAQYREQLMTASYLHLHDELGRARGLAVTQPRALLELMEDLRRRLDDEDLRPVAADEPSARTEQPAPGGRANSAAEQLATLLRHASGRTSSTDVRRRMPELYATCAEHAPDLLERALDAIWALRVDEPRFISGRRSAAAQLISSHLVNLSGFPDPSFPDRLISWVQARASAASSVDVPHLLELLESLLAKEGEHHVAEKPRVISFRPFATSVEWAGPVRERIRSVFLERVGVTEIGVAGAVARMLGEALGEPHGMIGRAVSAEEIVSWERDDLATIAALRTIASSVRSPVVRRLVRAKVAWSAQHAASPRVRHAALLLATELDQTVQDDLAEVVLHPRGDGLPTRRGTEPPSIEQVISDVERDADEEGLELGDARFQRISDRVRLQADQHAVLIAQVLSDMVASGDPEQLTSAVARVCEDIRIADPGRHFSLWVVWHQLARTAPAVLGPVVKQIAGSADLALDGDLHVLLEQWARSDEGGLLAWLRGFSGQRRAVREAVGAAAEAFDWTERGAAMVNVFGVGARDPDPQVRDRFLSAAHGLLADDPVSCVAFLLESEISPAAATRLLERTFGLAGDETATKLNRDQAAAVLRLVDRAGVRDASVQELVATITQRHPELVLDVLNAATPTPAEVTGIGAALEEHAETYVSWLAGRARAGDMGAASVVRVVSEGGVRPKQAGQLAADADALDGSALRNLTLLLRDAHGWPFTHPALARRFLEVARSRGQDVAEAVREAVAQAMSLSSWSSIDGVSAELNAARTAADRCAADEPDPDLRADFERARERIDATIASIAHEDDGE